MVLSYLIMMFLDEVFFVFLLLGVGWTSRIVILSFSSIKIFFNCYFSKCILYPYLSFGDCSDIYVSFMHASVVSVLHSIDCSLPSSFVHGILQARVLEWVAMPSSRGSSQPRDQTCVSYIYLHWQVGSLPLPPPGKSYILLCEHTDMHVDI